MSIQVSQRVQTTYLIFGTVAALLAALWCVAGAGIYGSPFTGMPSSYMLYTLAFFVIGPFAALPATLLIMWKPNWAASWLIVSGWASGALAIPWIASDAFIFPLLFVSAPMVAGGVFLRRLVRPRTLAEEKTSPPGKVTRPQISDVKSVLLGVMMFLVGFATTFIVFAILSAFNVTGLKREPVYGPNPLSSGYKNQDMADSVQLLVFAGIVAVATLARRYWRLRPELMIGSWIALAILGLGIVLR